MKQLFHELRPMALRAWRRLGRWGCTALAVMVLSACGSDAGGGSGTLRLSLTDAPACGFDAVHVTIDKIRVHQSSHAGDGAAGWSEIVVSPSKRLDLLSLTNGVLEELGQTALPVGKYTQMRLVLAPNAPASPYANSLVLSGSGGNETPLVTPSAEQTGLKINIDLDIAANQVADFVLDVDACKSIVRSGMSGGYRLKPVVSVIPRITDVGSVTGYVAQSLNLADTRISLQVNGVSVRSTAPLPVQDMVRHLVPGQFVLAPVPVGSYDLVMSSQGRVTATITGVPVVSTGPTVVNTAASPMDPPAATMRTAAGHVSSTGAASIDAVVRVLKTYTGGPVVEVSAAPVP